MSNEHLRAAFEAWVKETGAYTDWSRHGDGYAKPLVDRSWRAWCAATTLASRSSPEWQPIETAPKDGTAITYHNGKIVDAVIGYCRWSTFVDDDFEAWWDYERDDEACPEYWMPVISIPAALEQNPKGSS